MSTVKVAINGFGRIGRLAYRQIYNMEGIEVVAIRIVIRRRCDDDEVGTLVSYFLVEGRAKVQCVILQKALDLGVFNGGLLLVNPLDFGFVDIQCNHFIVLREK